tara:strand:- start:551 stop:817 length:267 start_codon:yes stop_codon:yes gene_type:complete
METAMKTYRIPKRYYQDHVDCDCVAPKIIKETKTHYIIDATENDAMTELRQRAEMYADTTFPDYWENGWQGVVLSAKATLKVIGKGPR